MNSQEKSERILEEIRCLEEDLLVFKQSRDVLQKHLVHIEENQERREKFVSWAVFQIIWNGLVLATSACEQLLSGYRAELEKLEGPAKSAEAPVLHIVRSDQ
jgi:hypothetical protein